MTITIAWWWLPIAAVLAGFAGAYFFGRRHGDYDMVSPLIGAGCVLLGIAVAAAFCLGRWFA